MSKSHRSFTRRILIAAFGLSFGVLALAKPRVLIVQTASPAAGESVPMDSVLADQLDRLGQVTPITWSMTEPEVRTLDANGTVTFAPIRDEETAHLAARALHCDYLLLIAAFKAVSSIRPFAKLSPAGDIKTLWKVGARDWNKDVKINSTPMDQTITAANVNYFDQVNVMVAGAMDWDDTVRTIASTWADQMAKGPFKHLAMNLRPSLATGRVALPGLVLPSVTLEDIKGDQYIKQPNLRLTVLRDMVDREPERSDVRLALYDEALRQSDYNSAAEVALISSKTFGADLDWHLRAAHALVLSGKVPEAKAEADKSGPEQLAQPTHAVVIGDIDLANGDYRSAIDDYSRSIQIRPTPEALVGRAVAYALIGNIENSQQDLSALIDAPGMRALEGYRLATQRLQQAVFSLGNGMSDLIPAIRLKPQTPEVIARGQTLAYRVTALAQLVDHLPNLTVHKQSLRTLDLACKLLDQAAQETLSFAQTGDDEAGSEATISLSEAMKSYRSSVADFQDELNPDN